VKSGMCEGHAQVADHRRGSSTRRGYDAAWQRARLAKLAADPICQIRICCAGAVATEVDHVRPIAEHPELRLEWSNLQSACKACNVAKRNQAVPKGMGMAASVRDGGTGQSN